MKSATLFFLTIHVYGMVHKVTIPVMHASKIHPKKMNTINIFQNDKDRTHIIGNTIMRYSKPVYIGV